MLNRIKESLTRYFSADRSDFPEGLRDIESDYNQLPGEPYPTIAINDAGNPERMIEFYVTGKQYDVYLWHLRDLQRADYGKRYY